VPHIASADLDSQVVRTEGDWVIVTRRDDAAGLTLGIARPIGSSLRDLRLTAMRNLGYGLALAGLACVGIVPLSRRLTRNLASLSEGAERLARGDLETRVPVRSRDELGRLAETFNQMAGSLRQQQEGLLERERLRKELEMSRRIQVELLPREPLRLEFAEVSGVSLPAREVGGDFFNYFTLQDGSLAVLVGDVSGKGVPAALLAANLQATLRARLPLEPDLAALATSLDEQVEASTPGSVFVTLFMAVLSPDLRTLRWLNAGHNPQYLLRAGGGAEALGPGGRPLGLLPGGGFEPGEQKLAEGDALFLYTDGLVDSENAGGDYYGQERLEALLAQAGDATPSELLARVESTARGFRDGLEAGDDATLVVLRLARHGS
jgi:sigma-B regulation protein RsbU (phosphoserine phosphatase)